jgi:hypothetical protein
MAREGDYGLLPGEMRASSEGGELNGALVRYLEEAIRAQEQRVKRVDWTLTEERERAGTADQKFKYGLRF